MSAFGNDLADACWSVFDRMKTHNQLNHDHYDLEAMRLVVQDVASRFGAFCEGEAIPEADFAEIVGDVAAQRGLDNPSDLRRAVINYHRLVITEGESVRPSTDREEDLLNPLMYPGESLFDPELSTGRLRTRLGHNHLLVHPECLVLLRQFSGRGHIQTLPASIQDTIVFARKLNQVRLRYSVGELSWMGLIQSSTEDDALQVIRMVNPLVLAFHSTESFLEVTEGRVDVSAPLSDVRRQLGFRLGEFADRLAEPSWQERLTADRLFRLEQGNSRIRLEGSTLVWLARRALVDPRWAGRVLKASTDFEALAELRGKLEQYWSDSKAKPPRDLESFMRCFRRDET